MSNQDQTRLPLRKQDVSANKANRSVLSSRGSEKRLAHKKFQDDGEMPALRLRSLNNANKKNSTENSERSHYSLFEEMSLGADVDPKNYEDRSKRRGQARMRALQQNMFVMPNDEDYVPELMYQHLQFRRIEKFMNNYIDPGHVVN